MKNHSKKLMFIIAFTFGGIQLFASPEYINDSKTREERGEHKRHTEKPSIEDISSHLFEQFDVDGSNDLDENELVEVAYDMIQHRPPQRGEDRIESDEDSSDAERLAVDILDNFDSDNSISISEEELQYALEEMHNNRPPRRG